MNTAYAPSVIGNDEAMAHNKTDKEHLAELLAHIDALSKQTARRN